MLNGKLMLMLSMLSEKKIVFILSTNVLGQAISVCLCGFPVI